MIKSVKALTIGSYVSMLFLGIASTVIGAAARNIGLTAYQIGLMITVQNIGFGLAVLVAGGLSDTQPKPRLLFVGSLILGVGFLTFYLNPALWLNLLIMFFIGVGIGTYEGITDVMLLDLHSGSASLHINVNHSFVTLGSIAITLYLLFLQMNWRQSVIQSGVIVLILALFFALTWLPVRRSGSAGLRDRLRVLAGERTVAVLFLCTALAVGAELGSIGVLTTYLVELRGYSQITSKIGLIVFLTGMVAGRLVIGYLTRQGRILRYVVTLFALSAVLFSALYLVDSGPLQFPIIFLAGVALSALLPLMLAYAGLTYRHIAGTVVGTIKVAIPTGGILLPFLMSLLAGRASLQIALLVYPAAFVVGLLLLVVQFRLGVADRVGYVQPN